MHMYILDTLKVDFLEIRKTLIFMSPDRVFAHIRKKIYFKSESASLYSEHYIISN